MGICYIKNEGKLKACEERKVEIKANEKVVSQEGGYQENINEKNEIRNNFQIVTSFQGPKLLKIPKTKIAVDTCKKEVDQTLNNLQKILRDNNKPMLQYEDTDFLPILNSIIPENENDPVFAKVPPHLIQKLKEYKWIRCKELYAVNNYRLLLPTNLNPEDIIQVNPETSYFIVALASFISKHYERFKKIFPVSEVNEKGIYAVRFYIQGIPKIILIDDFIPCKILGGDRYMPAFSHSREKEICIMLLEKAWAKANCQCYLKTWSGTPQEAFHALCEAPCTYDLNENYIHESRLDLLWQRLREAEKNNWMLTTITNNNKNTELSLGLPQSHVFSIQGVYEISTLYNQYPIKLLKLQNPTDEYNMVNFKGEFCENSNKWTREYKIETGFESNRKATFYVTFEEYYRFFHSTFMCKYFPNYIYNYGIFRQFSNQRTLRRKSTLLLRKSEKALSVTPVSRGITKKIAKSSAFPEDNNVSNNMKPSAAVEISDKRAQKSFVSLNVSINLKKISSRKKCLQVSHSLIKGQEEFIDSSGEEENNQMLNNNPNAKDYTVHKASLISSSKGTPRLKLFESFSYDIFKQIIFVGFELDKSSRCFFCLHQPQLRFVEDDPGYEIPLAFFIVAQYSKSAQGYSYVGSSFGNIDKLYIDAELMSGEYHIFAYSYLPYGKPVQLVVSTYSEQPILLNQYPFEEIAPNWIEAILIDIAKKNPNKEMRYINNEPNTECFSSALGCDPSNHTGFGIFYYENNSDRHSMEIILLINKSSGVKFLNAENPDVNDDAIEYRISVHPRKFHSLIYQIVSLPWLMQLEWDEQVWFELPCETIVKPEF